MKNTLKLLSASIITIAAFAFTAHGNLINDPSFESGTNVPSGMGGWSTFNGAAFSTAYARTGSYSMANVGGGGYSVPGAFQYDPATAGVSYLLTGYAFVPTALTGASQGFLQITFVDSTTTVNLGTVQTSPGNALVSTPTVTSSSPTGTWIFMSEVATAPAGTAYAEPFTLVLDATPTAVYFDDLSLTVAPEPSSLALMGLGLAGMFYFIRRRKMAGAAN